MLISHTEFERQSRRLLRTTGGNVFTGCMGRLELLNGEINPLWSNLARAKHTTLNLSGGNIKSNVYGGSELGSVGVKLSGETADEDYVTEINMTGGRVGTVVYDTSGDSPVAMYSFGSIFGGGYGSADPTYGEAGSVEGSTHVFITGGEVEDNVFGGGNLAKVKGNANVTIGAKKTD